MAFSIPDHVLRSFCDVTPELLKPHGIVVLESGEPDPLGVDSPLAAKFEVIKTARYGVAYVNILVSKK